MIRLPGTFRQLPALNKVVTSGISEIAVGIAQDGIVRDAIVRDDDFVRITWVEQGIAMALTLQMH